MKPNDIVSFLETVMREKYGETDKVRHSRIDADKKERDLNFLKLQQEALQEAMVLCRWLKEGKVKLISTSKTTENSHILS